MRDIILKIDFDFPMHMDPRLKLPAALAVALVDAAAKSIRRAARAGKGALRKPSRRQATLKPGPDTPLWNELADAVQAQLKKHGEKARLGRILGLPRQRVQDLLRARRHMPDAERTLLLLVWLHARAQGHDLA